MERNNSEHTDYLTKLYDREWLYNLCPAYEIDDICSIFYMDLDNYKSVNDLYGHEEGDRVLQYVADCLKKSSDNAYAVRMSGDEFVLVLPGSHTRRELEDLYRHISRSIASEQKNLQGLSLISVSAGAVIASAKDQGLHTALRMADNAMYEAKRIGKRRCVFFEDIRDKIEEENRITDLAPEAIANDRFVLRLNPLLNMQNSILMLTQIIAIWVKEDGTKLYPEQYRPILENNGFIRELDIYLLKKSLKLIREFDSYSNNNRKPRFSITLSWVHFIDRQLEKMLIQDSEDYDTNFSMLDFSVSEETLNGRNIDRVITGMNRISAQGISFSLCGFGSNFGSIKHMTNSPFSTIILDQDWLLDSLSEPQGRRVVKSMVRLTKELHKSCMVLKVVSHQDIDLLINNGCDANSSLSYDEMYEPKDYENFIEHHLPGDCVAEYTFNNNLSDRTGNNTGSFIGTRISFTSGISDNWRALHFPGGEIGENVVSLPESLFASDSYTIAFWVYP
ncbi:MAG: EAL domain-containing protein, partial [Lachnospiraceae bacterium]|nr:EAL domain-containing protein [Lachnospiraceae bacterium]